MVVADASLRHRRDTSPARTDSSTRARSRSRCRDTIGYSRPKRAAASCDVRALAREGKFRRVHSDDHQPVVRVAAMPSHHVRQRADAIDAGVVPEIDQHDRLVAQILENDRAALNPSPPSSSGANTVSDNCGIDVLCRERSTAPTFRSKRLTLTNRALVNRWLDTLRSQSDRDRNRRQT